MSIEKLALAAPWKAHLLDSSVTPMGAHPSNEGSRSRYPSSAAAVVYARIYYLGMVHPCPPPKDRRMWQLHTITNLPHHEPLIQRARHDLAGHQSGEWRGGGTILHSWMPATGSQVHAMPQPMVSPRRAAAMSTTHKQTGKAKDPALIKTKTYIRVSTKE